MPAAAIIPVRGFRGAKERLAAALDPDQRAALAEALFRGVLAAARPLPVLVVSADAAVARLAAEFDATVIADPGGGLDAAVRAGVLGAIDRHHDRVVIAHSDLPFADGLADVADLADGAGIVLVPDRHQDGTNVIAVDTTVDFGFRYGPGSFERHRAEARRLGVEPTVITESRLSWDVDVPDDLHPPANWGRPPWETADD